MVSSTLIRCTVGVVGNLTCLSLFISPLPTFYRICKNGSVGEYSSVPYLLTLLNCMMWVVYAIPIVHPQSTCILTMNSAGCVIEFIYLMIFVIYTDSKRKRVHLILFLVVELLLVGLLAGLVFKNVDTTKGRVRFVGTVGMITAIFMYASPLSVMKTVINTKSVEFMPFYLSLASFSNAAIWSFYGLDPFDLYVFTPSALGVVFGLAQLIMHRVYYHSTKEQNEANNAEAEMA